jgi:hypothetical protein
LLFSRRTASSRSAAVSSSTKALVERWHGRAAPAFDVIKGEGLPSIFTVDRGLETGEADRDEDGHISVDYLYDCVFGKVRARRLGLNDLEHREVLQLRGIRSDRERLAAQAQIPFLYI